MNRSVKEVTDILKGSVVETVDESNAEDVRARLRNKGARNRMPLNKHIDRAASRSEDDQDPRVPSLETLRARLAA